MDVITLCELTKLTALNLTHADFPVGSISSLSNINILAFSHNGWLGRPSDLILEPLHTGCDLVDSTDWDRYLRGLLDTNPSI